MASALSPGQLTALRAFIDADPVLSLAAPDSNGSFFIMNELNKVSNPEELAWRTDASAAAIFDAIQWDKFTQTDVADSTVTQTNRMLLVQTKQMNLQNMLVGRETIDASKANVRAGLRDAVIALPSGTGGANVSAGGVSGVNVLNACTRNMTRAEAIFAGNAATTGTVTADVMTFQGELTLDDVKDARAL